jgi:hypothetical protein
MSLNEEERIYGHTLSVFSNAQNFVYSARICRSAFAEMPKRSVPGNETCLDFGLEMTQSVVEQ